MINFLRQEIKRLEKEAADREAGLDIERQSSIYALIRARQAVATAREIYIKYLEIEKSHPDHS